jgi:hypothetical protein
VHAAAELNAAPSSFASVVNMPQKEFRGFNVDLHILFYKENDAIFAHCLEFDLIGDGETQEEALDSLAQAMKIQMDESFESGNVKNLIAPAPAEYWRMYFQGEPSEIVVKATFRLEVQHEQLEINEVVGRDYVPDEDELVMA